jgi:hypothetical protein
MIISSITEYVLQHCIQLHFTLLLLFKFVQDFLGLLLKTSELLGKGLDLLLGGFYLAVRNIILKLRVT